MSWCFTSVLRQHEQGIFFYEVKCIIVGDLQFSGLVPYFHNRKHGSMQAYIMLESYLRVLHPDPQAAGRENEPLHLT